MYIYAVCAVYGGVYTRSRVTVAREKEMLRLKESAIEAKLARMVREMGGLCFKFVSPGSPGVPDRIVLLPGNRVIFVELKTETGRLARIQNWQLGEMRKRGADVRVLKGLEQVRAFVEEVRPDEVHPA